MTRLWCKTMTPCRDADPGRPAWIETVPEAEAGGESDRAMHDIAQVIAYYNYVNRVADGLGVTLEQSWPEHWPE